MPLDTYIRCMGAGEYPQDEPPDSGAHPLPDHCKGTWDQLRQTHHREHQESLPGEHQRHQTLFGIGEQSGGGGRGGSSGSGSGARGSGG